MWHKGALVVLVFALAVLASARRLKAPALDKYYINRANEFHKQWAKEEGVVTLESGLQYKVLEKSQNTNPVHPTPADKVLLRFQVFIPDEDPPYRIMVGNNVYQDPETEEWKGIATLFNMSGLLEGWRRGVELMTEGDHWELYIPFEMAYGSLGRGDTRPAIPVFSPLIINVWLDKINPPSADATPEEGKSDETKPAEAKTEAGSSKDKEEEVHEEL